MSEQERLNEILYQIIDCLLELDNDLLTDAAENIELFIGSKHEQARTTDSNTDNGD